MARPRHPNKDIEAAVTHAEVLGRRVVPISGHAWGRLYCAWADRDGCMVSVWSTPGMRITMPRRSGGLWRGARTGKRSE